MARRAPARVARSSPASRAARYTTVTQWWSDGWTVLGSEVIEGHKRTSFLRIVELPRRVPVQLELAANIHAEETEDRRAPHRRRLAPRRPRGGGGNARGLVATCSSHGASSAAPSPPTCARARMGERSHRLVTWRVAAHAWSRPPEPEGHLPASAGLRFFRTLSEAAECLRRRGARLRRRRAGRPRASGGRLRLAWSCLRY